MAYEVKTKHKAVEVGQEDHARLSRLLEEVQGRVEEIARIVSRNLKTAQLFPVKRVTLTSPTVEAPQTHIEMEPILVAGNGNGCYKDPPGICCECPCP